MRVKVLERCCRADIQLLSVTLQIAGKIEIIITIKRKRHKWSGNHKQPGEKEQDLCSGGCVPKDERVTIV